MFLSDQEIDGCIGWLQKHAAAPVRYLVARDLLKLDPASARMAELWQAVEASPEAGELFSKQNPDGSWFCGGPWGPRGYRRQTGRGVTATRPKFVTTAWLLPYLGVMGFTAADQRVRLACDFILAEAGYGAPAGLKEDEETNCCGLAGIPLRALASVGLASDERLRTGWDRLARCQRGDGGWLSPPHLPDSPNPSTTVGRWPWDRGCAWGAYSSVEALYLSADPLHAPALKSALQFMLWHLAQKDPAHIQTWSYHGHNIVKELLMFSEAGLDMRAEPVPILLGWLRGSYRPGEGCFRAQVRPVADFTRQVSAIIQEYDECHGAGAWDKTTRTGANVLRYQLYHLVEDDWLTYYAARIAINLRALYA